MNVIRLTLRTLIAAGMLSLTMPAHAQNCGAPTTDGLVGYWTLDEASGTFADSSGNGFTGTQNGGVGYGAAGVVGDAASFDGNDDFITTSTSATLDPAVVTACAWVNRTGEGSDENWQEVIGNGNFQNYGWNLNLEPEATNATFFVNRSGARDSATVAIETTLGWHHYCGVFDGTYAHVYVDGKLGGTSVATSLADSTRAFQISESGDGLGDNGVDGNIDEVRVYNRVLTPEEIGQLYSYGMGKEGVLTFSDQDNTMYYCDGTDWVAMGGSGYVPNAVYFDGGSDQLLENSFGGTSPTLVTGSFWIRRNTSNLGVSQTIVHARNASGEYFRVRFNTSNEIVIDGHEDGVSGYNLLATSDEAITDGNWHHVLFSIDSTNRSLDQIYIDDVGGVTSLSTTYTAFGGGVILSIGSFNTGSEKLYGDLADLWVDFDNYIDWSVESSRRAFIDARGLPVDLGADGSNATGTSPDIFLSGDTANWHVNKGTSPGFTESGALTQSSFAKTSETIHLYDQYYAFVSDTLPNGDLLSEAQGRGYVGDDGVLAGDYICQQEATAAGLPGVYNAWLSGPAADGNAPLDKFYLSSVPYVMPNVPTFTQVADNWTDLVDGTIDNEIQYMADGTVHGGDSNVWTNVNTNGTADGTEHCLDWTSSSGGDSGRRGRATNTDGNWSDNGSSGCDSVDFHIYCIQQPEVGCADPAGQAGQINYNQNLSVMQYCDGYNWVAMGPVGGAPVTSSLIGHWALDETSGASAPDTSGSGFTGTLENMENQDWVDGVDSNALLFDGNNERVVIASNASFDIATGGSFSQFNWFKKTSDCGANAGGDNEVMVTRWGGNFTDRTWWFGCDAATDELEINFYGSATSISVNGPVIDDGLWHYGGWVYDGSVGEVRLYLDGELVNRQAYTLDANMNVANPVCIGGYDNTCSDSRFFFDGLIDDVRIYNRALSTTEVNQLYNYMLSDGLGDVDNGCTDAGGITGATAEGVMLYNVDNNVLQYCNGEEWVGVGK